MALVRERPQFRLQGVGSQQFYRPYIGDVPQLIPNLRPLTAKQINDQAESIDKIQTSVAAENDVVPLVYGRMRLGGKILYVAKYGGRLLMQIVWCLGGRAGIDGFIRLEINDRQVTGDQVLANHYVGTTTQGVDPIMQDLIPGYSDNLVADVIVDGVTYPIGICYSVLRIKAGVFEGFPRPAIILRGLKVHDPRVSVDPEDTASYVWPYNNPSLIDADFLYQKAYGWGQKVDWAAVATSANYNEEVLGTTKRREVSIAFNRRRNAADISALLAEYGRMLHVTEGDTIRPIAEKVESVSGSLNDDDIIAGSLRLRSRGQNNAPTVVRVDYIDRNVTPWAERTAVAYAPGVIEGTTPWRETRLRMPGFRSHEVAYRHAVERINRTTLVNLEGSVEVGPAGLRYLPGQVITLTTKRGLTNKQVRILTITPSGPNTWRLNWTEYSDQLYSEVIQAANPGDDVDLPDPLAPDTVTNLKVIERPYTDENGRTYSTLRATWIGSTWEYARSYNIVVTGQNIDQTADIYHYGSGLQHEFVTHNVKQGVQYTVNVRVVGNIGIIGDPVSSVITPLGKLLNPTNIPTLTGYEAGEYVFLAWEQAQDEDLAGYQIRRSAIESSQEPVTEEAWENAVVLDRSIRGGSATYPNQPVGLFRYYVRGHDSRYDLSTQWDYSIGFSPNPATVDVNISADHATALRVVTFYHTEVTQQYSVTDSNVTPVRVSGIGWYYIIAENDSWGPNENPWNQGDYYNQWLLPAQAAYAVTVETNIADLGQDEQVLINVTLTDEVINISSTNPPKDRFINILAATASEYPGTWRTLPGSSVSTIARYLKIQTGWTSADPQRILETQRSQRQPLTMTIRSEPQTQTGSETITDTAPPLGHAVTFSQPFTVPPLVTVSYIGSDSYMAVADAITTTGFNIYLWDISQPPSGAVDERVDWEAKV